MHTYVPSTTVLYPASFSLLSIHPSSFVHKPFHFLRTLHQREREREGGGGRQTDRQTDGRTDRQTDRETDGQRHRQTDKEGGGGDGGRKEREREREREPNGVDSS